MGKRVEDVCTSQTSDGSSTLQLGYPGNGPCGFPDVVHRAAVRGGVGRTQPPWERRAHHRDVAGPRLASRERLSGAQDPTLPVFSLPASRLGCLRPEAGLRGRGCKVSPAVGCPEPVTAVAAARPRGVGEETKEKLPVALPVPSASGRRRFPRVVTGRARDGALPASPLTDR